MRLMLTFFRAYPGQTLIVLLALLFAGVAEGIGISAMLPLLSVAMKGEKDAEPSEFERMITDTLGGMGITPSIGVLLSIIALGVMVKIVLLLIAKKQVGYTAAEVATDLRLELLRSILRSRWEYFLHKPIGALSNALATEAKRSADAYVSGTTVVTFIIHTMIYAGLAFAISWKATLIGLLAGTVIAALLHFLVRMSRRAGKKQTRLSTSLMSRLTDTLQSVKPIKSMAREHLADSVLIIETSRLNKALKKGVFSEAVMNAAREAFFAIFLLSGIYVAWVQMDMPLATVTMLAVVLGKILSQMGKVQKQYQKMVVGESAFWSLKGAIEEAQQAEEKLDGGKEVVFKEAIHLRDVRFSYGKEPIFDGLDMEIPAGQVTTLIGPSGAGKTTIIDLVIRLLQADSGEILIDDVPLSEADIKSWRRMIGYVPQETLLLHDTILHNVTLGAPELSVAEAEWALKAAGAWGFVNSLEEGIYSGVGERGGKLSGGQRQRIIIARALIHHPKLLILDEATSALDAASRAQIRSTIEELRGEFTILAISHQDELMEVADRIYELRDGKAVIVSAPAH
ncbi:MAG: ABC transporter ATP-binding protein/permease [gamma proteobacterium symbiont of Bathyaustriella thionipta]|nr:ABC transporter ATP-binding protein/permease [gamma proteobacterium symbiont of Bathyaustriella thionipta]